MILEDMETGTAGNDTGAFAGQFPQNLCLCLVDVVRGNVNTELVGEARVHAQGFGRWHGRNILNELCQPVFSLAL